MIVKFPEIQGTDEQKAQKEAEREAFTTAANQYLIELNLN
jgi:hypothetical protein